MQGLHGDEEDASVNRESTLVERKRKEWKWIIRQMEQDSVR